MYCQHCGKQIKDGIKYCTFCGRPQELVGLGLEHKGHDGGSSTVTQRIEPPLSTIPNSVPGQKSRWKLPLALVLTLLLTAAVVGGAWHFGFFYSLPTVQLPEFIEDLPFVTQLLGEQVGNDKPIQQSTEDEIESVGKDTKESSGRETSTDTSIAVSDNTGKVPESTSTEKGVSVAVKKGLHEYSWEELKAIAGEIESCTSADAAMKVSRHYNLVDSMGRPSDDTKDVKLSNGKTMHMRVVGVWHDKADTPSGKAGLSFLSDSTVLRHSMHSSETIVGGWRSSGMRSWLSDDLYKTLPTEVSSSIVPVYKLTNNTGETKSVSSVTETKEMLWLPSVIELCGPVDWVYQSDPENSGLYNSIFNAEGSQYSLFASYPIDNFAANGIFSLGGEWWLRSIAPASGKGRYVSGDGDPSFFDQANVEKGVVVGFCL